MRRKGPRPSKLVRQFEPDLIDAAKAAAEGRLVIFEANRKLSLGWTTGEKAVLLGILEKNEDGGEQVSPIGELVWDCDTQYVPADPLIMIANNEDVIVGDMEPCSSKVAKPARSTKAGGARKTA